MCQLREEALVSSTDVHSASPWKRTVQLSAAVFEGEVKEDSQDSRNVVGLEECSVPLHNAALAALDGEEVVDRVGRVLCEDDLALVPAFLQVRRRGGSFSRDARGESSKGSLP